MEAGQASKAAVSDRRSSVLAIGTSSTRTVITATPARSTLVALADTHVQEQVSTHSTVQTDSQPNTVTLQVFPRQLEGARLVLPDEHTV